MAVSDVIPYRKQIQDFLNSCTIHYKPFQVLVDNTVISKGYSVDPTRPLDSKYYVNMAGNYHESDTIMTILSLDTQQVIEFNKTNLASHRRTAKVYKVGTPEYEALCERYPEQVDLIKNIVYPVTNIEAAYKTNNFELLAWGDGFLEKDESAFIIREVRNFLKYFEARWFFKFMSYEKYWYVTTWSVMWGLLFAAIESFRIKAMRTTDVHSFHVWEYLKSFGLEDYSDILTRRQSMYLYRNIRYLLANQGKQETLILLVNNLLDEIGVTLNGRTIYQHTEVPLDEYRTIPDFTSEPVPTRYADIALVNPPQSTDDIIRKVYEIDLDYFPTTEYVDETERAVAKTDQNVLQTKFLEIRPLPVDRKYAGMLHNFIIDTLMSMVKHSKYAPKIEFVDTFSGVKLKMTVQQSLLLMYWASNRSVRELPIQTPRKYSPRASYRHDFNKATFPKTFTYHEHTYPLRSIVNLPVFLDNIDYPQYTLVYPEDLSNTIARLFQSLVAQIVEMRKTSDNITLQGQWWVFNHTTENQPYTISVTTHERYIDWIDDPQNDKIKELITYYESRSEELQRTYYGKLATTIIEQLVPKTQSLLPFLQDVTTDEFYARLKKLFVQLTSYNVLFLDTERIIERRLFLPKTVFELIASKKTDFGLLEIGVDFTGSFRAVTENALDVGNDFKLGRFNAKHHHIFKEGLPIRDHRMHAKTTLELPDTTVIEVTPSRGSDGQILPVGIDMGTIRLDPPAVT